jgi:hypothetical protein
LILKERLAVTGGNGRLHVTHLLINGNVWNQPPPILENQLELTASAIVDEEDVSRQGANGDSGFQNCVGVTGTPDLGGRLEPQGGDNIADRGVRWKVKRVSTPVKFIENMDLLPVMVVLTARTLCSHLESTYCDTLQKCW